MEACLFIPLVEMKDEQDESEPQRTPLISVQLYKPRHAAHCASTHQKISKVYCTEIDE
jgi:hypothetical protein